MEDEVRRPESPGMDMNLHDYLHQNGWGDTAEDPNDPDTYPVNHKLTGNSYNGFHNMGWTSWIFRCFVLYEFYDDFNVECSV